VPDMSVLSPVEVLESAGAEFTLMDHVPIVGRQDAEEQLGLPTDRLLKTMVFRAADGTFILVALPASGRVSYGKLSKVVSVSRANLRQANPDELALLGMRPGGASPVCGAPGVVIVFDSTVPGMGTVYCGSGRPDRTVRTEAETLVRVVQPVVASVTAGE
jgi:Cys-tRNA(Pro)/Cys-tRNA(Cys) deacylase